MKSHRPDTRLEREEYLSRAHSMARRGQELTQTKLQDEDVISIRSAVKQRDNLRKYIRENLSNEAMAKKFGVHVRTVEKCISYESFGHIP